MAIPDVTQMLEFNKPSGSKRIAEAPVSEPHAGLGV
jgi:hypothetical protein